MPTSELQLHSKTLFHEDLDSNSFTIPYTASGGHPYHEIEYYRWTMENKSALETRQSKGGDSEVAFQGGVSAS